MKNLNNSKTLKLAVVLFTLFRSMIALAITPEEMVKHADLARMPQGSVVFTAKIKDISPSSTKETHFQISSTTVGTSNFSLVETIFPERLQGRKLLMRENDLWIYLPTVKRPTRISFRERLSGEVSNGDLTRTNFAGDYDATLKGTETVDGKPCVKLLLKAKHKDVTYSLIDYWLDAKTYAPVKAAFYALSGKLIKTGTYSEPKVILGATRLTKILIKDALQPSRQSLIEFSNFKQTHFAESLFNKESLSE